MRLTLRTMLAYLDDILEPGDAEELSQKIEESKFASELVHRIRSSTRRLRLGAPNLEGRGMGLDPNTVAEYLDNTLPTDHVPDFEKVCLESDVHLAEVASCHQVLALVLGEPADLDQAIRERVYRIGQSGPDGASDTDDVDPTATDPLQGMATEEGEPPIETAAETPEETIPDYMKTGSRISMRSLAITLICAFALAAVALRAMHPFDRDHPVFRMFVGGDRQAVVQAPEGAIPEGGAATDGALEQPQTGAADQTPQNLEEPAPSTTPEKTKTPAEAATEVPQPDTETEPPSAPPAAPERVPESPPEEAPATEPEKSMPAPADNPAPEEVVPVEEPKPASVGRFVSEEQVLGRLDPETGSWKRLRYKTPLSVGDRLIVLPTFRPLVHLGDVHITFSGPTSVELAAEKEPESPNLAFDYGRAILVSEDDHGARADFSLAGRDGFVTLPNAESALALEVRPYLAPGLDPQANAALAMVGLYATNGQITWTEGSGDPLAVEAGQVLVLAGDDPPELLDAAVLPDWYDRRDLSELERSASSDLITHITTDRPMSLSLLERAEFRRIEVAVLACRCLSYLGDFTPILGAMNGEHHAAYWDGHYDCLRAALARGGESAAKVLETLKKTHAEDAPDFFRMLWSYSPEQLKSGEADRLVATLEHNSMIARVLAKENLMRITGKSLQFRPEHTPEQETSKVTRWRRELEDGLIRYKNPPAAMPAVSTSTEK